MQGIADYGFVRQLGEGAHGTFYLATTPARLGLAAEHVAVKVLRGTTDEDAIRRATRELRAFAAASSPSRGQAWHHKCRCRTQNHVSHRVVSHPVVTSRARGFARLCAYATRRTINIAIL